MKSLLNENELVQAIKAGDKKAFASFYASYVKRVRALLLFLGSTAEIADDICQDTFARLWETREKLNEDLSLKSYTRNIARNLFIDHVRKSQVRTKYNDAYEVTKHDTTANPHDLMVRKELKLILSKAVNQLPEDKQIIFTMSRMEGSSYQEIARDLNTTPKAVERHIARSLTIIRDYILRCTDLPIKLMWIMLFYDFCSLIR